MMLLPERTPLHPDEYISFPTVYGVSIIPTLGYYIHPQIRNLSGDINKMVQGAMQADHTVYVPNGRERDRIHRRLRRIAARKCKTDINTCDVIQLPAKRDTVTLTLLPVGEYVPGYHPSRIERKAS